EDAISTGYLTLAAGSYSYTGGRGYIGGTHGSGVGLLSAGGYAAFNHSVINDGYSGTGAAGAQSAILGGTNNSTEAGATNSVVLGGENITATEPNTVYVPNLKVEGRFGVEEITVTKINSNDSIIKFGDSTIIVYPYLNRIYTSGPFGLSLGKNTLAANPNGIALGNNVAVNGNGVNSIAIGSGFISSGGYISRLINSTPNSLIVGFNSERPTLFVGPAEGYGMVGKVGIGTITPEANLHIKGNAPKIILDDDTREGATKVEIYNNNGIARIHTPKEFGIFIDPEGEYDNRAFAIWHNTGTWGGNGTNGLDDNCLFMLNEDGLCRLNGKFMAEEVNIRLDVWSDYVFKDGYKLMNFSELEKYIKIHNHLPDVPSEQEVLENGVNLGEMDAILLKKIEELTLYMIQLKKENDRMSEEIQQLKNKQ
ncbi:MAG: hypothetical protein KKD31_11460, partial [Bacteroidetes bacterium]|nr:hypothetical protein [Bacteroidota bacterium]